MYRGVESDCALGWGAAGGFDCEAYPPAKKADGSLPKYVYMETPDGDYYCGYDLQACTHPQSLLVTEMSRQAADAVAWRTATATYADQVWLQTDQAHRACRVYG